MSVEEEPSTINSNEKNETVDNQIKNKPEKAKIHLKHIKANILSPPDTPQINLKKVDINISENEKKCESSSDISINLNNNNEISELNNVESINDIKVEENNSNNDENVNDIKVEENNSNNDENINDIKVEENNSNNDVNTIDKKIEEINSNSIKKIENKKENEDSEENIKNEIVQNENNDNNVQIKNNDTKINNIINNDNNTMNLDKVKEDERINKEVESSKNINEEKKNEIIKNNNSQINTSMVKKLEGNKVIVKVDILNKVKQNEQDKNHKMPRSEINICTDITRSLQLHSRSYPFLKPVDPVLLNIPDYLTIIKHPMDLSTIMSKIKENKYKDINEYISDVELMFNNCFTYNPPANPVHIAGLALKNYFIEQLRRLSPEVQASLKILKDNDNNGSNIKDKRPKRQIKAVQHLEPEFHLPKKMKVIHKYTIDNNKEENSENNISNEPNIKKEVIYLSKINSTKTEEPKTTNKTTIRKLIATTRATSILESSKGKSNKNNLKNVENVEEEDVNEIESDEQVIEEESEVNDEVDEIEEEEEDEEDEEDDEEDDDEEEFNEDDASTLKRKTNSLIRASQKVLSRMKSKNSHTKIRNISAQTGSISKKSTKSKLLKSLTKVPSITLDQIYPSDPVDDLVERQINNLTMCLQNVTKQLELLQVQSKARQLKKKAKRLAKSLNINSYDYQSESDDVEELLNQTALLTSNTNKLLKRKASKTKLSKLKELSIPDEEESDEEDDNDFEERRTIKKKGKSSQNKVLKKVNKRTNTVKQETKGRRRTQRVSQENSYDIKRVCEYCGDTDTPMWRRGPNGKGTLCNKCGVKWKGGKIYQGEEIPIKMKKNKVNPPKRERKTKTKVKDKKKETNKGTKSKQPKVAEITYSQKKELSEMISYLSEEKISGVVDIIRSSIPDIKDTQEEIELDIETIDPATLFKLYNYVKKVSKPKNGKKKENKNEETSSDESSVESSDSEEETSDSDSEPNQFM